MSQHARERCAEMEISTKIAKRIVADPNKITYPDRDRAGLVALSKIHPEYAAVYVDREDGTTLVITVLFREARQYVRNGAECVVLP